MDVACLDFQKTFDKVPYKRWIFKVHGIGNDVFNWIENGLQTEDT